MLNFYPLLHSVALGSNCKHKVACAIFSRGRLLGCFSNLMKSHPVQARFAARFGEPQRIYLHAEINALVRTTGGDTAMVYRCTPGGAVGLAKPCGICMLALETYGISEVYYSIDSENYGYYKNYS